MTQESKLQLALNMEEVELLTAEYWTDVIDYKCARFSYPHEPISTNESESLRRALSCLIPDCSNVGAHRAPGGAPKDRLCCEHYEQFIAHLLDPLGNPTFPK